MCRFKIRALCIKQTKLRRITKKNRIPKKLTLETKLEIIFLNTNHLHENLRKMHKRNKI